APAVRAPAAGTGPTAPRPRAPTRRASPDTWTRRRSVRPQWTRAPWRRRSPRRPGFDSPFGYRLVSECRSSDAILPQNPTVCTRDRTRRERQPKLQSELIGPAMLSAMMRGYAPAWALGDAGGVARFPVLAGIKHHLTIIVDNDSAGRAAASKCSQ